MTGYAPFEIMYTESRISYLKGVLLMRIIFKIIAAPFVVILTIFVAVMRFLFRISGWVFTLASFLLAAGGVVTLISGGTSNGLVLLIAGFLASPYGVPMLAVHLSAGMQKMNYALRDFITS